MNCSSEQICGCGPLVWNTSDFGGWENSKPISNSMWYCQQQAGQWNTFHGARTESTGVIPVWGSDNKEDASWKQSPRVERLILLAGNRRYLVTEQWDKHWEAGEREVFKIEWKTAGIVFLKDVTYKYYGNMLIWSILCFLCNKLNLWMAFSFFKIHSCLLDSTCIPHIHQY